MRTALTYHEPPEELCMLSSLYLTAAFISKTVSHYLHLIRIFFYIYPLGRTPKTPKSPF